MLQVLCEIILSILCVYGGYRLLHDLEKWLTRPSKRRSSRRKDEGSPTDGPAKTLPMSQTPPTPLPPEARQGGEDENPAKGGKDAENNGRQ